MAAFGLNVSITDDKGKEESDKLYFEARTAHDAKEQLNLCLIEEGKARNVLVLDCWEIRERIAVAY